MRARTGVRTRTSARAATLAAVATVGLTGCGFHGLYSANLPGGPNLGSRPYSVTIEFANVLDLVPQSSVKVNDVAVGKVMSVSLSGWTAKVKVKVNANVDLPANARATVKQTSLLGEKFVALEQPLAEPEGKLEDSGTIPLTSTGTAPEVEEVLGALSLLLNGGGLEQIRTITTELNKALKGNEGAVRDLLTQLNGFVGGLDRQKDSITTALADIDKLAITLNRQKRTIIATLDTFPQALSILKNERSKLTTLLQSLARLGSTATSVITATQTNLVSSLKTLSPVLESLSAAGSDLPNALKILLTFPFPLDKTTRFVRGDYANLSLFVDLNLGNELCGLNAALCGLAAALTPDSAAASPLTPSSATTPNASRDPEPALPVIPGTGG
jgi:phospholipid/cholesterol/gamma-HCH transport system substrate-binding protein